MTTENNETTNNESPWTPSHDTTACLVGGNLHATVTEKGATNPMASVCMMSVYLMMNGMSNIEPAMPAVEEEEAQEEE